jgi:hypothetical protein
MVPLPFSASWRSSRRRRRLQHAVEGVHLVEPAAGLIDCLLQGRAAGANTDRGFVPRRGEVVFEGG